MKTGIVLVVVICVAAYLIGRNRGRAKGRGDAMRKLTEQYEDGVIRSHQVRQADEERRQTDRERRQTDRERRQADRERGEGEKDRGLSVRAATMG
jgi:hypothetical protein